jgi:hypothetical protein
MEHQTQNKTPKSKGIFQHATKAMVDLSFQISTIRSARSNVNRLIQIAPSDKPVELLYVSEKMEAMLRDMKTELNLWIQKHFRGGEDWHDQSQEEREDQDQECPEEFRFNEGHDHLMTVVMGGVVHECLSASCTHYSSEPVSVKPLLGDDHNETVEHLDNGNVVWYCSHPECKHFISSEGFDEVDA